MENGGKEKQFFASQTSQVPVSGGKGWQFYATCFAKNNENGCKPPRIKGKILHPENRKWVLSMARFTDGIAQRSVYNLLRNSINIKAPAVSPLVLYDSE